MNIALLGYGKMGKVLEEEAIKRGHVIVLKINSQNSHLLNEGALKGVDVAIEFSNPETVLENIYHCFDYNVPIVVGTTGWLEHWDLVTEDARCRDQTLFFASNFSLGVNLFFQLNTVLAKMMNEFPEYGVSLLEIHHKQKKDSPSGTALTLADSILEHLARKKGWVDFLSDGGTQSPEWHSKSISEEKAINEMNVSEDSTPLEIYSHRIDPNPGTHEVIYSSEEDEIRISHMAKNRRGFALGAIFAAEWVLGKNGVFTMNDLMNY